MPPKVEAVVLAAVLVSAWMVLENSRRIDLTRSDVETGRWTTVATCQNAPAGSRYSAASALAADGDDPASSSVAGDGADVCETGYRTYTASDTGSAPR